MKTHQTIAGNAYVVYSKDGCTVTDSTGTLNKEVPAGDFLTIPAPSDALITSDDNALVRKAHFKRALAALGLLGGGNTGLPAGFLQAYFLESNGGQYVEFPFSWVPAKDTVTFRYLKPFRAAESYVIYERFFGGKNAQLAGAELRQTAIINSATSRSLACYVLSGTSRSLPFQFDTRYCFKVTPEGFSLNDSYTTRTLSDTSEYNDIFQIFCWQSGMRARMRLYGFCNKRQGVGQVRDMLPAITKEGKPCLHDKISKESYTNSGSGSFIVGFTLTQARKLGKLAPGSSFTISLPAGWQEDAGVVEARAQAEANGCVLPVQEYTTEGESAAATYALRRIWVKRTPDALGGYVDAYGQRWLVEWCVDVIGAAPETLGYERFRSVDAAAAYWELTLWVDTEDKLLTEA